MLFEELPKHNCRPWSVVFCFTSGAVQLPRVMDQITIKTPNPKCHLYWCFIEFIDWRNSQSCWYFRPLLWTSTPLTFSLVHLPPPPRVNKYRGIYLHSVKRWGGDRVVWRAFKAVYTHRHCVFDQVPILPNCFTTPNKNLGGEIKPCRQFTLQGT